MTTGTPTQNTILPRLADFATLSEALDYAAEGVTGYNFYNAHGQLTESLPYTVLRSRALSMARRLAGLGIKRGDRVAIIADTDPNFPVVFFACQYAGFIPVALPIYLNLGGHQAFVRQLQGLFKACKASIAVASAELLPFLQEAAATMPEVQVNSTDTLATLPEADIELQPAEPDEIAYLQFTSGSTQFPRGVVITESAVMSNLRGIVRHGLAVRDQDRCVSWLPFYHDMGLVGFLLGPLVSQVSVDYMRTRDFAVRPLQWLNIITRNRGTIAFSPPFGYTLCAKRVRSSDVENLDLSSWRIAGVGAELIQRKPLERFAECLKPAGFNPDSFLACYGLAEASLAVTFAPLDQGLEVARVSANALSQRGVIEHAGEHTRNLRELVYCGQVMPEHELVIRDEQGNPSLPNQAGRITIRGPSLMSGYFDDAESTANAFDDNGWLDTGDLGCMTEKGLLVTGRSKDLIIVNGRNIWPQDIEHLAEEQVELRTGDAIAFAVTGPEGEDKVVLVLQCRLTDPRQKEALCTNVRRIVRTLLGVDPLIDLVPPHTLPRTSSGKPSRTTAKKDFLARQAERAKQANDTATNASQTVSN